MDGVMDKIFKALGDPTRLQIFKMLAKHREVCVCKIVDELGMNQPAISHHMAKLKQVDLVNSRKEGQWIHYSLNIDTIKNGPLAFLIDAADAVEKRSEITESGKCCSR